MKYSVEILRSPEATWEDRSEPTSTPPAIRNLSDDPRPLGTKKLSGRPAWRIRVGSYRITYEINDNQLRIL